MHCVCGEGGICIKVVSREGALRVPGRWKDILKGGQTPCTEGA